jgi:hypothetical protein
MATMKAARFYQPHQPLRVESAPVPECGRLDLSESISIRLPLGEVNRGLEILRDKVDHPVRVIIEPAA